MNKHANKQTDEQACKIYGQIKTNKSGINQKKQGREQIKQQEYTNNQTNK